MKVYNQEASLLSWNIFFVSKVKKNGLGGVNSNIDYKLLELLRFLYVLSEIAYVCFTSAYRKNDVTEKVGYLEYGKAVLENAYRSRVIGC